MLGILAQIDRELAQAVGDNLGLEVPETPEKPINHGVPADADREKYEPQPSKPPIDRSPALSMIYTRPKDSHIATRKIAFLAANGVDDNAFSQIKATLEEKGATVQVIAPKLGTITTKGGESTRSSVVAFFATNARPDTPRSRTSRKFHTRIAIPSFRTTRTTDYFRR